MKNIKVFLLLFLSNVIYLTLPHCYGQYFIKLDATTNLFFNKKAEIFREWPDACLIIEHINKEKNLFETILKKLIGFNTHNDREETDCCEICYFIKMLNDKQLCFSENDKQIILQTLETLTTWFIRNSFYIKDMEEAKKLFLNFNFNQLFIFVNDVQTKKGNCIIL